MVFVLATGGMIDTNRQTYMAEAEAEAKHHDVML
jgi:hypothetical protein